MFFNFEENEIKGRIFDTVTMKDLGSKMFTDPDLYNPLWIDMTLVFVLSVVGNL